MKAYMRVDVCVWGGGGGGNGVECPPLPQVSSDCVHRDEIWEIVSSILFKGIKKLHMTRPFSIPFIIR